jgi:ABC-type antimicrobial peptide transport system permease subunit
LIEQFVLLQQELFGETSYVSMVQNALDRDSTALVFKNLSDTISGIEYTVLSIIILMSLLITLLISLMVIGDNKNLASIMKALGYTDGKNILSFLFIYVPVVLISLAISIPLGMGIIAIFSEIVFNGAGIYLTSTLTITGGCYSILIMLSMFVVSGFVGLYSLKNETLVERMKKL